MNLVKTAEYHQTCLLADGPKNSRFITQKIFIKVALICGTKYRWGRKNCFELIYSSKEQNKKQTNMHAQYNITRKLHTSR